MGTSIAAPGRAAPLATQAVAASRLAMDIGSPRKQYIIRSSSHSHDWASRASGAAAKADNTPNRFTPECPMWAGRLMTTLPPRT
eukprot:7960825-Lingulodinium_polyedra.AAC.1